jgi:hypothetical protein
LLRANAGGVCTAGTGVVVEATGFWLWQAAIQRVPAPANKIKRLNFMGFQFLAKRKTKLFFMEQRRRRKVKREKRRPGNAM